MNGSIRTSGALLTRNATLNLLAEGILFVILVLSTPLLVARLGVQAFGLYALAWSIIGYLAYLEFGISRSATQFVSKYLSQDDSAGVARAAVTSILINILIGLACGLVVLLLTPILAHEAFRIPAELQGQARLVFFSVALAVPLVMLQSVLRAIAASYQEFAAINLVNLLGTALQYALACFLAWKGSGAGAVVLSTVLIRFFFVLSYAVLVARLMPGAVRLSHFDLGELRRLFRFGGWVTASQLVLQMLVYVDRFLLASLASLGAVTLFTVPFEAITRLRVMPASVMATVYPAMAESTSREGKPSLQPLYEKSIRYLLLLMLPLIMFIFMFGKALLTIWMGTAFAAHSAVVFQILSIGFLLNSLAYVSYHAIQAVERPEIVGKYHLLIFPIYIAFSWVFVRHWGISGAAAAASLRYGLDALLLFWVAERYCDCSMRFILRSSWLYILLLGVALALGLLAIRLSLTSPWLSLLLGLLAVASFYLLAWHFLLNAREKPVIARAFGFSRGLHTA